MDFDYEICFKCGEIYEDVELSPFCAKCSKKEEKVLIA